MESEALRNVRTMRQIRTNLDLAQTRKARTTNSLSRTGEESECPVPLTDRLLGRVLEKERRRSAAHEAAADRVRQRLLKARAKLAATIARNQALTRLRYELQLSHWQAKSSTPMEAAPHGAEQGPRRMDLRY